MDNIDFTLAVGPFTAAGKTGGRIILRMDETALEGRTDGEALSQSLSKILNLIGGVNEYRGRWGVTAGEGLNEAAIRRYNERLSKAFGMEEPDGVSL